MGESGLINSSKKTYYPKELKCAAVDDYLSGNYSQLDVCKKYKIRSTSQLHNWILKYNSHEEIKSYHTGGNIAMTKGRNTTFEERVEIVKHCIENDRNYSNTSEKYKVSYQQVRNWIVKYENNGLDALIDRRGKNKSQDKLTELDRLKLENKLLQAKNKRLEIQNELLKKLEEIERGW
jgi:transposase-like protein